MDSLVSGKQSRATPVAHPAGLKVNIITASKFIPDVESCLWEVRFSPAELPAQKLRADGEAFIHATLESGKTVTAIGPVVCARDWGNVVLVGEWEISSTGLWIGPGSAASNLEDYSGPFSDFQSPSPALVVAFPSDAASGRVARMSIGAIELVRSISGLPMR